MKKELLVAKYFHYPATESLLPSPLKPQLPTSPCSLQVCIFITDTTTPRYEYTQFLLKGDYSIIFTYLHIFVYELASNSDVSISFHTSI